MALWKDKTINNIIITQIFFFLQFYFFLTDYFERIIVKYNTTVFPEEYDFRLVQQ